MYELIPKAGPEVCRCLMWKGKLLGVEWDPTVPPSNDRNFWCVHTQACIGPDGHVAEPEGCIPGRSCHEGLS